MIAEFQCVSDNSTWLVDTDKLKYYQITSLRGINGDAGILLEGNLSLMGSVFAFKDRHPSSPSPGEGLCVFGILAKIENDTLNIIVSANVPIKDFKLNPPVQKVVYVVTQDVIKLQEVPDNVIDFKKP